MCKKQNEAETHAAAHRERTSEAMGAAQYRLQQRLARRNNNLQAPPAQLPKPQMRSNHCVVHKRQAEGNLVSHIFNPDAIAVLKVEADAYRSSEAHALRTGKRLELSNVRLQE